MSGPKKVTNLNLVKSDKKSEIKSCPFSKRDCFRTR